MTLAVWLIGYAILLVIGYHVEQALCRRWDLDRAAITSRLAMQIGSDDRKTALEERKFERLNTMAKASDPMPQELVDRVLAWEDDWAQDAERRGIMELYAEYGDWAKVMTRLPSLKAPE